MVEQQRGALAQRSFIIEAPQSRVWDLLATVIYRQLPLEKVDIVSLDRFNAVLKWRLGFINFSFNVQGILENISRPDSYGCIILVKKGPMKLGINVTMICNRLDEHRTQISCMAMDEFEDKLSGWLLKKPLRNFSLKMFDAIGERIKHLC